MQEVCYGGVTGVISLCAVRKHREKVRMARRGAGGLTALVFKPMIIGSI